MSFLHQIVDYQNLSKDQAPLFTSEAKNRAEGKPDPLEGLDERARNWIYAQSDITDDGGIVAKDPEAAKVVEALKGPIKAQIEAGLFKPEYHKDQLSLGLGTAEHGGRVRAISSSASLKEGFSVHLLTCTRSIPFTRNSWKRKHGKDGGGNLCCSHMINSKETSVPNSRRSAGRYKFYV